MTMTIDANQQRFGHLNFDHMSSYSNQPHFTNPWVSSSSAAGPAPQTGGHGLFVSNHDTPAHGLPHLNLSGLSKHPQHGPRGTSTSSTASMPSYGSVPVTAASAGSTLMAGAYGQENLLSVPQDLLSINRLQHPTSSAAYGDTSYTTASPVSATYAPSPTPYDQLGYAPAPVRSTFTLGPEADHGRRYSQPGMQQDDRRGFQDALEASHGMLSMSQETPRNIYDVRHGRGSRGSQESYGFPSAHSSSSSISSTGFSGYYAGSVDSSVSDYSTAGSDLESLSGRTLPRPHGLIGSQIPPAPQSMMGQFSSKVSSSTQKKHKCKVCDKRFTRPSSLQTHMYSHTGEKPFSCEVEGCGRQFSVVSNLRRHRKVHKNNGQHEETPSETGSEDHQSE
ncbi:hypothetical protein CONLIGDRAFT_639870 [Coniochaeta ligniaria NRRL 30616]|uniref:C2H2-type domain-containing protein n=1 Tax=Coniochaeta ligniaria NRRL 30616 TaxID=1408157 RepID=A0A1J7J639_9PEZI|nr:hypothetical protein CONLIGDRAFT_639870 [Coniochaeta ligniaria NRRL 30616]